jgi:hypothetical protein
MRRWHDATNHQPDLHLALSKYSTVKQEVGLEVIFVRFTFGSLQAPDISLLPI